MLHTFLFNVTQPAFNIQLYSPLLVEKSKSIKNKQTTKE